MIIVAFVDELSENEKKQIEYQLQMVKDCGKFYYEFSNRLKY